MLCPICEAENPDDSVECATCGGVFRANASAAGRAIPPIEGLEATQLSSPDLAVDVEPLAGLERTELDETSDGPPQWVPGSLPLERTQHEAGSASAEGAGSLEVDRGREADSGERTPQAPESATCPWCGTPSLGAVCDSCGRRKSRFVAPVQAEQRLVQGGIATCPACFARVVKDVRCSDCGMPFPLQEL
jgi:hypothetical protein